MEYKIVFYIISFLSLQIIVSSSFQSDGNKTNFMKFRDVLRNYNKYIKSPPPGVVMISTRDAIDIKARRVEPQGLIVLRCPTHIDIGGKKRKCVATREEVKMGVLIVDTKEFVEAKTYNEVKCSCRERKK
nr:uncharacterized protein LOC111418048 [Onthophagus taurus]